MVEIKKGETESISSALRRFTKRLSQTGVLIEARKNRFRKRKLSDYKKRKIALFRLKRKKEVEKLRKLGKL